MYTIRRPAEMRAGGDESSTIDNDIRQTIQETNCYMNGMKDKPIYWAFLAVSKDKQIKLNEFRDKRLVEKGKHKRKKQFENKRKCKWKI